MAVTCDHEDGCQFEIDAMQSKLRASQGGLPLDKPQSSSYEDLDRLRTLLTWSFGISLLFTFGVIIVANISDDPVDPDDYLNGILMVLIAAMGISGLGFLVALGRLATRLGRSGINWVGSVIIFPPIGAFVAYFRMLSLVDEAQKHRKQKNESDGG